MRTNTVGETLYWCYANLAMSHAALTHGVDHLVPRKKGGPDVGENMVWACRSCNSSKGASDALEWLAGRQQFPPLLLLRRYLKLAIEYCAEHDLMDQPVGSVRELPFALNALPRPFPHPEDMVLWTVPLESVGAAKGDAAG